MAQSFKAGSEIQVMSATGPIARIVVAFDPIMSVVSVSTHREVERAKNEQRLPISVGFHTIYVLDSRPEIVDNCITLKHNVQYEQTEHGGAGADRRDDDGGQ
jgi:hypothetical protein